MQRIAKRWMSPVRSSAVLSMPTFQSQDFRRTIFATRHLWHHPPPLAQATAFACSSRHYCVESFLSHPMATPLPGPATVTPVWVETMDDMLLHFTEKRDMHTLAHFRYRNLYYSLLTPTIVLSASISAMSGIFPNMIRVIAAFSTLNTCIISLMHSLELQAKKDQHLTAAHLYAEFRDKQWQLWMKLQVKCHDGACLESAGTELAQFMQTSEEKRAEILPNLPVIPWDIRKRIQGSRFRPTPDGSTGDKRSTEWRLLEEQKAYLDDPVANPTWPKHPDALAADVLAASTSLPRLPALTKTQQARIADTLRATAALPQGDPADVRGEGSRPDDALRTALERNGQKLEFQVSNGLSPEFGITSGLALERGRREQQEGQEQDNQLQEALMARSREFRELSDNMKAVEQHAERHVQLEVEGQARRRPFRPRRTLWIPWGRSSMALRMRMTVRIISVIKIVRAAASRLEKAHGPGNVCGHVLSPMNSRSSG